MSTNLSNSPSAEGLNAQETPKVDGPFKAPALPPILGALRDQLGAAAAIFNTTEKDVQAAVGIRPASEHTSEEVEG